ncbi:MAG: inorganic pyrophosphatase [Verrucomicrobia bacterium]|nr:inorganic pyrophosphatase [Verrucomicrobiota bacterium]
MLYQAHPWHGVPIGAKAPEQLTVYVEIVPTDTVKYEVDKLTGHLMLDRPQTFSNVCPSLYGLIPQTLAADRVAALTAERTGRADIVGDQDPLDICVLTERSVSHGNILVQAIPVGGFRMIDSGEADDKIVAVLEGDPLYGNYREIQDCPPALIERLRHYFLTYKQVPGVKPPQPCEITHVYGRDEALDLIRRSCEDYRERFPDLAPRLAAITKPVTATEGSTRTPADKQS